MWNNGRNGEFTGPMGQESIIKYTIIAEVKALGIDEDSPLFHTMVKLMTRLGELEERKFGAPIATLPHDAYISHISQSAPAFGQPQYERPFHYDLDQHGKFVFDNQSELAFSAPETDRTNSEGVSTKLPIERPCYFDQYDRLCRCEK